MADKRGHTGHAFGDNRDGDLDRTALFNLGARYIWISFTDSVRYTTVSNISMYIEFFGVLV